MCKKLIFLVSPFLLLILSGNALAQLDPASVTDGHVYLFENVVSDVPDDSANSHTANLVGSPQVVDGLKGKALHFDGVDDGVHIPDDSMINLSTHQNHTVIAIFKCDDVTKSEKQVVYDEGGTTRGLSIYVHEGLVYGGGWNLSDYTPEWTGTFFSAPVSSNAWYAVAIVLRDGTAAQEDDKFEMWMDGVLIGKGPGGQLQSRSNDCAIGYANAQTKFHDGDFTGGGSYFQGTVDEVWIINTALTQIELGGFVGKVWPYAWGPTPANGALYKDTWVSLAWSPGGFAVSHDVYLGENFEDVNAGAESTFRGNQAATSLIAGFSGYPYPDGLVPGTTYYWRVDEVNEAEPNSPWKGNVWSFTIPPKNAYEAYPPDGAKFIFTDVILSWNPGFNARLHYVYFGDNFDDVNNAAVGLPMVDPTYTPATLDLDKTYYWRVDEFDGAATNKGDVWSFTTKPAIEVTDPDLICWWTLDEGNGRNVLDWSGQDHHGTFRGEPQWVEGYHGGALKLDGINDDIIHQLPETQNFENFTVALWVRADALGQGQYMSPFSSHTPNSSGFQIDVDGTNPGYYRTNTAEAPGPAFGPVILEWVHLALVVEGTALQYYYNGTWTNSYTYSTDELLFNEFIIGSSRNNTNYFNGAVDDLRVYTKALTQDEVQLVMRGDPLLAWNARPVNGSLPNLKDATPLSWSPGDNASQHDIYFGTDRDAVADANESDTSGIYRGRQGSTSFTPAEGVEWGGGPYYWRIDEYNTDGTISTGRIWTFTVADFIGIDDFESYDTGENQIWYAWKDGLGYGVPGTDPYYPGNGSGSAVGDENSPSYTEETIVHSGGKSMPLAYDNNKQGFFNYSEAELTLTYPRDWTESGVGILSLWFYGLASNAAEPMYVALNGNAIVTHNNPNAAQIEEWTEWTIDLQEFADQGVSLTNINTIAIGFGDKKNPLAGGAGIAYFDDIRLLRPLPEPEPEPEP